MKADGFYIESLKRLISTLLFCTFLFHKSGQISAQDCFPNGLMLSSQSQINNFRRDFPDCSIIDGDLRISGRDISNLDSLSSILIVRGDFVVDSCPMLMSLDGLRIYSVERYILINNNDQLSSLDALDQITGEVEGFSLNDNPSLERIGSLHLVEKTKRLFIYNNPRLIAIDGFSKLIEVSERFALFNNPLLEDIGSLNSRLDILGALEIYDNPRLSDCSIRPICNYLKVPAGTIIITRNGRDCNSIDDVKNACPSPCLPGGMVFSRQSQLDSFRILFPDCDEIQGNVTISGNSIVDVSALSNIRIIRGDLNIIRNPELQIVKQLDNLKWIGEDFRIEDNPKLKLVSFSSLDSVRFRLSISDNPGDFKCSFLRLRSIGQNLVIVNNGIGHLDLAFPVLRIVGSLFIIAQNTNLSSLRSLDHNIIINGNLEVYGNTQLSTCNIISFCKFIKEHKGTSRVIIQNNDAGCLTESEILSSCNGCLFPDGIRFTRQGEIDSFQINYPGCNCIEGSLSIRGHGVTEISSVSKISNLDGLKVIKKVGGGLYIIRAKNLLTLDGLSNLQAVSHIDIEDCDRLKTLSGLVSLRDLTSNYSDQYTREITISYNDSLIDLAKLWQLNFIGLVLIQSNIRLNSLDGIHNIDWSGSNLILFRNSALSNLDDFKFISKINSLDIRGNGLANIDGLNNLESILGLSIADENNLFNINGLNKILKIGVLDINSNSNLISISGFNGLKTINNGFFINYNDKLNTLNIFSNVDSIGILNPEISTIQSTIVENKKLRKLDGFNSLKYIAKLFILNNDVLEDLSSLDKPISMTKLYVTHNPNLSNCSIESFCNMAINYPEKTIISNNSPGCNSVQEVQDACSRRRVRNQFVVSEGASHMTGSGMLLRATLGQPIISVVQSPGTRNSQGFWYHFRDVLISKDVIVELDQVSCTLYPNPVDGELVLDLTGALPGYLRIELLDIDGRIHRVWDMFVDDPQTWKIVLDLSTIPQGSYLLRLNSGRHYLNSKVIKRE